MEKQLPILEMLISESEDDSTGVFSISFVDSPAIESKFLKFNKDTKKINFSITNEEKKIVSGPVLIPDKMIYRNDNGYEYYAFCTKETIEDTVFKFFKTNKAQNVDLQHDGLLLNGITLFESFIIDKERGINTPVTYPEILPDGTWYVSYKVNSDEIWNACKEGVFNGFSISGLFNMNEVKFSKPKTNREILDALEELFSDL